MYYQFMYTNMCILAQNPYIHIYISVSTHPYWCCLCVSWHRNGFMLFSASQKKRIENNSCASLRNFSTFSSFLLDKKIKEMRVLSHWDNHELMEWLTGQLKNKQDWSKCRTGRQLNSLDLRTSLCLNGYEKGWTAEILEFNVNSENFFAF